VVELLIDLFRRALEGTRPELGFPDAVFGLQGTGRKRAKSAIEKVRGNISYHPSAEESSKRGSYGLTCVWC
ncbi:unnamed protein product, partial [Ectocarpus sp. 12 AP-2014]